jgi:hypothetical protein
VLTDGEAVSPASSLMAVGVLVALAGIVLFVVMAFVVGP